jgi:hypothetical protein
MIYLSIFLFARQANAQYYLTPVKVDNLISVSMPKEYVKSNQGGQNVLSANGTYGSMVVIRSVNPVSKQEVKNVNGLDNVFKEYVKNVQRSLTEGNILNDHDTTIGKLTAHDFILQLDTGSGSQSRCFRLVYTKNVTYTFEYLYDDFRKDLATGEMKAFFQSVSVSPELTTADQYIITAPSFPTVRVIIFSAIASLVIGIVIICRRRPGLA